MLHCNSVLADAKYSLDYIWHEQQTRMVHLECIVCTVYPLHWYSET